MWFYCGCLVNSYFFSTAKRPKREHYLHLCFVSTTTYLYIKANKMDEDLQYYREHCTGTYIASETAREHVLSHVKHQYRGLSEGELATIADGFMKVDFSMDSLFQFKLTNKNGKATCFFNNIVHNGFMFTDLNCQSIGTIGSYKHRTLTITMRQDRIHTKPRKYTYTFYERIDDRRGAKLDISIGTSTWQMTYIKVA